MTIDEFIALHEDTWQRLALSIPRVNRKDVPVDLTQFISDLEATQTHLNVARYTYHEVELVNRLSKLVQEAGHASQKTQGFSTRSIFRWFIETFPAAVWEIKYWILLSFTIFLVAAVVTGWWVSSDKEVLDLIMPEEMRQQYIQEDFINYYSESDSNLFFSKVTTNNIGIAIQVFAGGILFTIPAVAILFFNGASLGQAWAVFQDAGQTDIFWTYIAPHGFMELSAIFVAGGTGMALGWVWFNPGMRTRAEAFKERGEITVTVALGAALMLLFSGIIEGYITGSAFMPMWFKVLFGFMVWLIFCTTVLYLGFRASQRGLRGTLSQAQRVEFATEI